MLSDKGYFLQVYKPLFLSHHLINNQPLELIPICSHLTFSIVEINLKALFRSESREQLCGIKGVYGEKQPKGLTKSFGDQLLVGVRG